ncbi:MAG: stage 0 sporulation family protein [Planctomycetota bacterium]
MRHGCASCRATCSIPPDAGVRKGDAVVARTERGVEYARVLTDPRVPAPGEADPVAEMLHPASDRDTAKQRQIDSEGRSEEYRFCRDCIRERDLPMRLSRVEKLLGGGRMVFYFRAERRVDFRDLVRDLAGRYRMRIELRQIGARDEAAILGDVSYCGRELCCSSWIREMKPVTMKMAKNQKSTLDPSKISGMCGRLLCCLRYEDEVYTELRRKLPRRGSRVRVRSTSARGLVLHQEVLAGRVVVLLDRGGTAKVAGDDLVPERDAARPGDAPRKG